ncbi:MAG: hypothetical protein ABH860_03005 [bacterium]
MKNIRLIVPVIICLALSFYIIGCGSATSGGSSSSGGTTFKLVDPAIVGAKMFMDTNFNGTWDVGEISSEGSNAYGYVEFSSLPTMDANMLPLPGYLGTHVGVSYEGFVARYFSTLESGALYITPATSLMTKSSGAFRFTSEEVAFIMTSEAGITVNAADVVSDPMEGIDDLLAGDVTDTQLRKIRASICIYSFVRVMDSIASGSENTISFDAFVADATAQGQLQTMGAAVRGTLNTALINSINSSIESNTPAGITLPLVSAGDVAKTAVVITNRIIEKVIASSYTYEANVTTIADWAGQLGVRFYCQRNKNNAFVRIGLDAGAIQDSHGAAITYNEVNTAEAWRINTSDNIVLVP